MRILQKTFDSNLNEKTKIFDSFTLLYGVLL